MKTIVFLSLLVLSSYASAQYTAANCDVNALDNPTLTAEAREHFRRPFDQHGSNMCYAHVAADILTFRSGFSISPIALSVLTSQSKKEKWSMMAEGEVVESIEAANTAGAVCKNSGYNSYLSDEQYNNLSPSFNCGGDHLAHLSGQVAYRRYRDCLPGFTPRHELPDEFKTLMLSQINTSLDSRQIVAVSLVATLLDKDGLNDAIGMNGDKHVVSIIGRKWNSVASQCEYVIKNSYGSDGCAGEYDETLVNCKRPEGFPEGTISITEQTFRRAVHRVVIIKPAGSESDPDVSPENCVAVPSSN